MKSSSLYRINKLTLKRPLQWVIQSAQQLTSSKRYFLGMANLTSSSVLLVLLFFMLARALPLLILLLPFVMMLLTANGYKHIALLKQGEKPQLMQLIEVFKQQGKAFFILSFIFIACSFILNSFASMLIIPILNIDLQTYNTAIENNEHMAYLVDFLQQPENQSQLLMAMLLVFIINIPCFLLLLITPYVLMNMQSASIKVSIQLTILAFFRNFFACILLLILCIGIINIYSLVGLINNTFVQILVLIFVFLPWLFLIFAAFVDAVFDFKQKTSLDDMSMSF